MMLLQQQQQHEVRRSRSSNSSSNNNGSSSMISSQRRIGLVMPSRSVSSTQSEQGRSPTSASALFRNHSSNSNNSSNSTGGTPTKTTTAANTRISRIQRILWTLMRTIVCGGETTANRNSTKIRILTLFVGAFIYFITYVQLQSSVGSISTSLRSSGYDASSIHHSHAHDSSTNDESVLSTNIIDSNTAASSSSALALKSSKSRSLLLVEQDGVEKSSSGASTSSSRSTSNSHGKPPISQAAPPDKLDENIVTVVISSDRMEGVIPVIASILQSATKKSSNSTSSSSMHSMQSSQQPWLHVVVIGTQPQLNQRVQEHFGSRLAQFTSLTISDIERDLQQNANMRPIWMWDEWHSSLHPNNGNWNRVDSTIRPDAWDNRAVHAHELNHVRFYLPHLSLLANRDYVYLVDDDILVQSDVRVMATTTLASLPKDKGLVSPCSMWSWTDSCQTFGFTIEQERIVDSTPIYGNRKVCADDASTNCVPASYQSFVDAYLKPNQTKADSAAADESPTDPSQQLSWNFGFSLLALRNWRELQLTQKYEAVMKESYRHHIYPETSLPFGLGVAFLAFAGAVECWNDDAVKVRDGFGFIDYSRMQETFDNNPHFMDDIDVIHYTGSAKPWSAHSTIHAQSLQPWLDVMAREGLDLPPQHSTTPTQQLFTVIGSSHTDTDRIMRLLDHHAHICASGEADMPEIGFPSKLMDPAGISWHPTCSVKKGCTYAFVRDSVRNLTRDLEPGMAMAVPPRCQTRQPDDALNRHWTQMCNIVAELRGNFTDAAIARVFINAYQSEDKRLLSCSCKRGATIKGIAISPEWLEQSRDPSNEPTTVAAASATTTLDLTDTNLVRSKVVRLKRRNHWPPIKARLIDEATQIWDPQTSREQEAQIAKLPEGELTINVENMLWRLQISRDRDAIGDAWARQHASSVLWLYYEDCRLDAAGCLAKIGSFLNVDMSGLLNDKGVLASMFSDVGLDGTVNHVRNKDAVQEALQSFDSESKNTISAS